MKKIILALHVVYDLGTKSTSTPAEVLSKVKYSKSISPPSLFGWLPSWDYNIYKQSLVKKGTNTYISKHLEEEKSLRIKSG